MIYCDHITQDMMDKPITELSKLIASKCFLPLDKFAKEIGVGKEWLMQAVRGEKLPPHIENRLREALEIYDSRCFCLEGQN